MKRVASKVAVVTGGALGIGRACVERLAEEGAAVAILDVLDEAGQALADRLTEQGRRVGYWHADVASEEEVRSAIDAVTTRFGGLSVLVNNAGISGANKPTHEVTEKEWDH